MSFRFESGESAIAGKECSPFLLKLKEVLLEMSQSVVYLCDALHRTASEVGGDTNYQEKSVTVAQFDINSNGDIVVCI